MHEGPVVVFSGGGTGGHLYPALAIADALRELRPDVRALFVGSTRGVEARVLPARGESHHLLPIVGMERGRPLQSWRAVPALVVSLVRVARLFARVRPEVVVVTGGYAGAPAGIVAGLTGVALVLQEQNSVPGVVTRGLTRWARSVHVAFPEAISRLPHAQERVRVTGNPVRPPSERGRAEARAAFDVPADAVVVLVVGGSQGALGLNTDLTEAVTAVQRGELARPERLHLLWATGPAHHAGIAGALERAGSPPWVRALPYIEDMPAALAAADVALCRAGAMFTAELLNQGLPAILVPLPTAAADHQSANARALELAGAAVHVPQAELTPARLWRELSGLLADPAALGGMRRAALARARPDAAKEIAADIEALLPPPERRP